MKNNRLDSYARNPKYTEWNLDVFLDDVTRGNDKLSFVVDVLEWIATPNSGKFFEVWESANDATITNTLWSMPERLKLDMEPGSDGLSFGMILKSICLGELVQSHKFTKQIWNDLAETVNRENWIQRVQPELGKAVKAAVAVSGFESFTEHCHVLARLQAIEDTGTGFKAWWVSVVNKLAIVLRQDDEQSIEATLDSDAKRWQWFADRLTKCVVTGIQFTIKHSE